MDVSPVDIKPLRSWSLIGALIVVYFLAGKLGLQFAFLHSSATAVWPPTGIALAAVLLLGYRVAPAIFIGAFLVNITTAGSLLTSLGIAAGNTLEALTGAFPVNRYANGRAAFRSSSRHRVVFVARGSGQHFDQCDDRRNGLVLTGYAQTSQFGAIWLTWWLGDATGALIVTPLLPVGNDTQIRTAARRPAESMLLLLTITGAGALVFLHSELNRYPLPFLCIPPLIWAAFRFGQRKSLLESRFCRRSPCGRRLQAAAHSSWEATTNRSYCCRHSWARLRR